MYFYCDYVHMFAVAKLGCAEVILYSNIEHCTLLECVNQTFQ